MPEGSGLDLDIGPPPQHDLSRALGLDPTSIKARRLAREIVLGQLALAFWCDRWLMYSRDRSYYSSVRQYRHPALSYVRTTQSMDSLRELDLIEHQTGSIGPNWRYRSRARLRPEAISALPIVHVSQLPVAPKEVIRLKNGEKQLVPYQDTEETRCMRREVLEQNEAIGSAAISLQSPNWRMDNRGLLRSAKATVTPIENCLSRIFNVSWQEGGRYYRGWWQNLPETDRRWLRIDGSAVHELDVAHIHPTLMAAGAVVSWGGGDPYIVDGLPRELSKRAFQILVNAATMRAALGAVNDDLRRLGVADSMSRAKRLIEALTDRHPQFARFWGSGLGRRLQRIDSDLCTRIHAALRAKGIVGLSVHDSFIVPEHAQGILAEIVERELALICRKLQATGVTHDSF